MRRPILDWSLAGRALRRPPRDWWLGVRIVVLLGVVHVGLRTRPLPRLVRALTPRRPRARADRATAERTARYLDVILAQLPGAQRGWCLPRSLVLYRVARRAGLPVRFHCGARREGDGLTGHAWLTLGDEPFAEADRGTEFAVMYSYP